MGLHTSGGPGENPPLSLFPLLEATEACLRMGHEMSPGEGAFPPRRFHSSKTSRKSKTSITMLSEYFNVYEIQKLSRGEHAEPSLKMSGVTSAEF